MNAPAITAAALEEWLLKSTKGADPMAPRQPFALDYAGRRWLAATDGRALILVDGAADSLPEPIDNTRATLLIQWLVVAATVEWGAASLAALRAWAGTPEWSHNYTCTCDGCGHAHDAVASPDTVPAYVHNRRIDLNRLAKALNVLPGDGEVRMSTSAISISPAMRIDGSGYVMTLAGLRDADCEEDDYGALHWPEEEIQQASASIAETTGGVPCR